MSIKKYEDLPERVTPTEFCVMYGKNRTTVWAHQKEGKIPFYAYFEGRPSARNLGYTRDQLAQIFGIEIPNQPASKAQEASA